MERTHENDETKRLILARRARFMAAALASVATTTIALGQGVAACGGETTEPADAGGEPDSAQPGRSATQPSDGGDETSPQPCVALPSDAGEDEVTDANAPDVQAPPRPCLKIMP